MIKATARRRDLSPTKHAAAVLLIALLLLPACKAAQPRRDSGTATLSRELAEARRQMEEMHHRLSVLQFMVDSHERAISDLERDSGGITPGKVSPAKPVATPQKIVEEPVKPKQPTPEALPETKKKKTEKDNRASQTYTRAFAAMKEKDYDKALALFREVAEKWPDDNLADNAIYWSGEIHYDKKDYSGAISAFRTLLSKYPKGSKAPDALLKTGYSFLALKDKESARKYLKRVVVEYPFTTSGAKAEKALNSLDEN